MRRQTVIDHFGGTQTATAAALGITKSAVNQWPEIIPERFAWRIQQMTAGALKVDPALYERKGKRKRRAA